MRVSYTRLAEQDIINNYRYGLNRFGQQQADSYETELRDTIQLISDNPYLARERHEFKPAVRIHHTGKHYLVYLVQTDEILVLRILRDEVELFRHLGNSV